MIIYHSLLIDLMPFCRECGKEIEDDWKTCPFCSVEINLEKTSISDTVIMGDYNVQTNIESKGNVKNHILTLIDALKQGREERALEIFELAKKIDYDLAIQLYNVDYNKQITELKINLIKTELSLIKKSFETSWLDSSEETLNKLREKSNRMNVIISKCQDLFNYTDNDVLALDLLYEIWRYTPVLVSEAFGQLSHDWFISKYDEMGESERSEDAKFLKKVSEIRRQEGIDAINDMLKMGLILIGLFVIIMIII